MARESGLQCDDNDELVHVTVGGDDIAIGATRYQRLGDGSGSKGREKCLLEVALFLVDCCGVVGRTCSKRISCTKLEDDCKDDRSACVRGFLGSKW